MAFHFFSIPELDPAAAQGVAPAPGLGDEPGHALALRAGACLAILSRMRSGEVDGLGRWCGRGVAPHVNRRAKPNRTQPGCAQEASAVAQRQQAGSDLDLT